MIKEEREDAIKFFKEVAEREVSNAKYSKLAIEALEKEPCDEKTGKWIDDEFGSKCSYCGKYTHLDKFDRPMKFMYCSMCGAKMIKSEESEEEK